MLTIASGLGSIICFALLIYPYLIYPLLLKFAIKTVPQIAHQENNPPINSFTLLFCAFNEEAAMPDKIKNLICLKKRYPTLEVLAYDDGSTDGTAAYIEKNAKFVKLVRGSGRRGKAHGMKKLAAIATNEILVFTDANVTLATEALDNLSTYYENNKVGGVCGTLRYHEMDATPTARTGGLYWRLEEKIKDLESETGNVIGADGSIFSIRKVLYPDFPDTVLDDFTVSMHVVFQGYRLIKSNSVVAYENLSADRADEIKRKIRIAARSFHTHRVLQTNLRSLSQLDRFKYFSHKLLRWFGGLFLILGFIFGFLFLYLIAQYAFLVMIVALPLLFLYSVSRRHGVLSIAAEIMISILATFIGVLKAIMGETMPTWQPSKSR